MTRLEEARWLAQELYSLVRALQDSSETGNELVDSYIEAHDVEWISE